MDTGLVIFFLSPFGITFCSGGRYRNVLKEHLGVLIPQTMMFRIFEYERLDDNQCREFCPPERRGKPRGAKSWAESNGFLSLKPARKSFNVGGGPGIQVLPYFGIGYGSGDKGLSWAAKNHTTMILLCTLLGAEKI